MTWSPCGLPVLPVRESLRNSGLALSHLDSTWTPYGLLVGVVVTLLNLYKFKLITLLQPGLTGLHGVQWQGVLRNDWDSRCILAVLQASQI